MILKMQYYDGNDFYNTELRTKSNNVTNSEQLLSYPNCMELGVSTWMSTNYLFTPYIHV